MACRSYVSYLSTSALVRAMEKASRELSTAKRAGDHELSTLWARIGEDLLEELASRQLQLY